MAQHEFDVFISYNSKDSKAVQGIAKRLKERDLKVWLDEWELQPGKPWLERIEQGLMRSRAFAVFIGPRGIGPWEQPESGVALNRQVKEKLSVIPVLLPGARKSESGERRPEEVLPPFLAQSTWVDFHLGLSDDAAFEKLVWGITGVNPLANMTTSPVAPSWTSPQSHDVLQDALTAVEESIVSGDVTYFLGRSSVGLRNMYPAAPCEVSAQLLSMLDLVTDGYAGLVPEVESVASLVAATRGERALEKEVVRLINGAGDSRPEVHTALAVFMKILESHGTARRARRRAPRLIVTTNFDLYMERALLRAGMRFTRLVQFRSEPRIDVTLFDQGVLVGDGMLLSGGKGIELDNNEKLDDLIYDTKDKTFRLNATDDGSTHSVAAMPIEQFPEPILYKCHGSQDVENSCAISTDQFFDATWRLSRLDSVPSRITEIIGNSSLILLGSSVLDHDFRQVFHTLFRKPLEINSYPRFAIWSSKEVDPRDPGHQMTQRAWSKIEDHALSNYRIRCIDAPATEFLRQLTDRLARRLGVAA